MSSHEMSNQIVTDYHEGHEVHESLLTQEWDKAQQNRIIKGFKEGKNLSEMIRALPGFEESFNHPLDCLDCADGRVCSGHKLGLAGQGILLGAEDLAKLEAKLKELNITITGHDNCGAAGIACQGAPDSDVRGYAFTKGLAEKTGRPYAEVHKESFVSPVHNERCLVLEGTGRFDVANLEGFPGQFISSAEYFGLSEEYQMTEAKALIGIALGNHGFGERFNSENPFYLLISATDKEQLSKTKAWAEKVAADYDGKVKVHSFIAPEANK